jgi:hypothetical protein
MQLLPTGQPSLHRPFWRQVQRRRVPVTRRDRRPLSPGHRHSVTHFLCPSSRPFRYRYQVFPSFMDLPRRRQQQQRSPARWAGFIPLRKIFPHCDLSSPLRDTFRQAFPPSVSNCNILRFVWNIYEVTACNLTAEIVSAFNEIYGMDILVPIVRLK